MWWSDYEWAASVKFTFHQIKGGFKMRKLPVVLLGLLLVVVMAGCEGQGDIRASDTELSFGENIDGPQGMPLSINDI